MAEGASLKSHISNFNAIIFELRSIDVKIEDEVQALLLLVSLSLSSKNLERP